MPPDSQLLERYVSAADHDAFAQLVRRHIGFVRAAAMRQTRDPALADDVTQAVMIVLARKASTISSEAALPGWLFTVTRHAAQNAMKTQARRRFHEHAAAARRSEQVSAAPVADLGLRDVLDEALSRLGQADRSGVIMHYLYDCSHEQVGAALGLSADAARKRVTRALEKMRAFLGGRGVAVSGVALAAGLRAEAASAAAVVSTGFIDSTINIAMLSGSSSAVPGASLAIAQEVTRMLTIFKLKVAALIAIAGIGITTATAIPISNFARSLNPVTTTVMMNTANLGDAKPYTVEVAKGVKVEFLGVSTAPADEESWFTIAGERIPLPNPQLLEVNLRTNVQPDHELAVRVVAENDAVAQLHIEGATMVANSHIRNEDGGDDDGYMLLSHFSLGNPSDTVSVRIGVATADWKTVATSDKMDQSVEVDAGEHGTITLTPPEKDDIKDGMKIEAHHRHIDIPYRIVAFDKSGKALESNNVNVRRADDDVVSSYSFDLPADQFAKVEFQTRDFDKFIEASNISLVADQKTEPVIKVTEAKK